MGKIFEQSEKYLPDSNVNNIILEIGSDRYEGSTGYLARLAASRGEDFHTVDISKEPSERNNQHLISNINYHVATGSKWTQEVLPTLGKKISMVYLDNFDWIWDEKNINEPENFKKIINELIKFYRDKFNLEMNNNNSQIEHMIQGKNLLPFMDQQGIIVCDDTYKWNGVWVGKCGSLVVWLETENWSVVEENDFGVIIRKNL